MKKVLEKFAAADIETILLRSEFSGHVLRIFLTKFWWFEPILMNFVILISTSKFCDFDIDFKMINHRGGILIFCQILSKFKILDFRVKDLKFCDFVEFWILGLRISNLMISWEFSSILYKIHEKLKILLPNCKFGVRVKDFKFRFSLGLRISNFHKITKIQNFTKNHKIFTKKFLISQILWVLGFWAFKKHRFERRRCDLPFWWRWLTEFFYKILMIWANL